MPEKSELLRELCQRREALLRSVEGLSEGQFTAPGAIGETWSAQDALAHITAWEREFVETVRAFVERRPPHRIEGLSDLSETDRWNERSVSQRRNWPAHEVLIELGIVHNEFLALLSDLTEEQLGERIELPWGESGRVQQLFTLIAEHDDEHTLALQAWHQALPI